MCRRALASRACSLDAQREPAARSPHAPRDAAAAALHALFVRARAPPAHKSCGFQTHVKLAWQVHEKRKTPAAHNKDPAHACRGHAFKAQSGRSDSAPDDVALLSCARVRSSVCVFVHMPVVRMRAHLMRARVHATVSMCMRARVSMYMHAYMHSKHCSAACACASTSHRQLAQCTYMMHLSANKCARDAYVHAVACARAPHARLIRKYCVRLSTKVFCPVHVWGREKRRTCLYGWVGVLCACACMRAAAMRAAATYACADA
eukprot:3974334-Pleurochrysis_carterae.AAC.2